MMSDMSSIASSFQLRLAVTVIISVGNIAMLVAMSTNRWIKGNGEANVEYAGLWKVCTREFCLAHSHIIYSKILLVIAILFGIFCNVLAILALVYDVKDIKSPIARFMLGTGLLALCGMVSATVFFVIQTVYESIAYGLVFGWLSTILYLVAAIMSFVHHKYDPDAEQTMDQLKRIASMRNQQPPPYTAGPPPSTVVVS